jgi:hypothetical protein
MNQLLKDFGKMSREEQKGILIRCFRNFGKTTTGLLYAREIEHAYPEIFKELMTEINVEWEAALKSISDEKEASN